MICCGKERHRQLGDVSIQSRQPKENSGLKTSKGHLSARSSLLKIYVAVERSENWAAFQGGQPAPGFETRQKSSKLGSQLHSLTGGLSTAKPADGFLK